jgi:hypothetical protein
MKIQSSAKLLSMMLAASCWLTQQTWAQSATQNSAPQPQTTGSNTQAGTANQQSQDKPTAAPQTAPQQTAPAQPTPAPKASGTTINPSQAPLQPVTTYPDATGAEQQTQTAQTTSVPNAPQPKTEQEPQGAATAEKVATAGGAAAKPAGVAIAPAKQHRTRSILIKVGALAAAGVAAGTVYALSKGTSSTPPGANSPIAQPR